MQPFALEQHPKAVLEGVKGWVAGFVLAKGRAARVETMSPHFRLIRVATSAKARPGDKVQVEVGGLVMRTYSPFAIDAGPPGPPGPPGFSLLAFIHGDGPGATWARSVVEGDPIQFFGPRSSGATRERATVFGDETSIAVAAALGAKAVIESAVADEAELAAKMVGVDATVIARAADESHLGAMTTRLRELGAPIVLTGRSKAIIEVRKRLRAHGLDPRAKAYWDLNKKGLD